MTTRNGSDVTRDFVAREIRVLILGCYKTALTRDAFLSLYKHQVTAKSKATTGLSMILNGGAFDCVLLDSDACDMNFNYFVHRSSKLLPDLKIILMAPNDTPKEMLQIALFYKSVWLRVKPCGLDGISNVIEHIINRKMELLKKEKDRRSIKRKQYSNFPNIIEGWSPRRKENAYPYTIPEQMILPDFSRNHIARHLQVDIERGRLMKEPVILLPEKTNQNLNIQNYAGQRLGLSTPSHCDASAFQSNSLHRPSNLNSLGSLTMHVDSICSKLQQNSSSFFPVLTAATCGSQAPDHIYIDLLHQAPGETSRSSALRLDENPHSCMAQGSQVELQDQDYRKEIDTMVTGDNYSRPDFGEVMATLDVDTTVESPYNLGADANCVSDCFNNSNSGGACDFSEAIPTLDVGASLRSEYIPGVVANIFSNGIDNSYSGGASGSGMFEAPATSLVGANVTSQYNLGENGNLLSNGFGNRNSGGVGGSGISEAPATFVVGDKVESQYSLRENANVYSNGFDNSNSGGSSGTGIPATFVVGVNVESQYNIGGNATVLSHGLDNSNFGGASGSGILEALPTSVVVANVESQYDIWENANIVSNGFHNSNSGGASSCGLSEELATVDVFGIPIDSHTTATGGVPSPTDGGLEDLAFRDQLKSSDSGGDFRPQNIVDKSQTLGFPVSAGEEEYANNMWLNNMIETDSNISMGNYYENYDVFSDGG